MSSKKKKVRDNVFTYATRTRVALIVITVLLLALIPLSYFDHAAWIGKWPVITIVLIPLSLIFVWIAWQETYQVVTIHKESIVWEHGRWKFRKEVEIPFDQLREMHDDTTLFSVGRKFSLYANGTPEKRIKLNGAIDRYRDMLRAIVKRIPRNQISKRALKSLQRIRVI